jgi:hypothetical protein
MSTDTTVDVRQLQAQDLFTLLRIGSRLRDEITQVVTESRQAKARGEDADMEQLGINLVFAALAQADSEIKPWLASMAQLSVQDFEHLPLGGVLELVEGIIRQEDWSAFLGRVTGLVGSAMPAKSSTGVTRLQLDTAGKTKPSRGSRSAAS